MENHTEILNKVAERIKAFEQGGGDMEEDLWQPAREVLADLKSILQKANPPVFHQSYSD